MARAPASLVSSAAPARADESTVIVPAPGPARGDGDAGARGGRARARPRGDEREPVIPAEARTVMTGPQGLAREPANGPVTELGDERDSERARGRSTRDRGRRRGGSPRDRGPDRAPEPAQRVGDLLAGTYRVERHIADGGMGSVFEVVHTRLQQRFAVKLLDRRFARNAEAYARFRQEAQIAAALDHPSIAQVIDFNTDDWGNPYMVMELVEGDTLDVVVEREGRLREPAVLGIFGPLCSALDAAHRSGIVHRDLKPSNVMVRVEGERYIVKLLDFGISKIKHEGEGDEGMTRENVVMGTPHYMSPEQAEGKNADVDLRTDVYALGAILYEALCGQRPFDHDGLAKLLHAIVYEPHPPLRSRGRGIPRPVADVIDRALSKRPADRYGSALELYEALEDAYHAASRRAEPGPARKSGLGGPWVRAVALSGAVVAAWAGSLVGVALWSRSLAHSGAAAEPATEPAGASEAPRPPSDPRPRPRAQPTYDPGLATPGAVLLELDGQLYRADPAGLAFWDGPDADPVKRPLPSPARVGALAFSRDATALWVAQDDGTLSAWDRALAAEPTIVLVPSEPGVPIEGIAASADYLAIGTASEVRLLQTASGKLLRRFPGEQAPVALLLTRTGAPRLLVVRPTTVEVIDADGRRSEAVLPLLGRAVEARFAADGNDLEPILEIAVQQGGWLVRRRVAIPRDARGKPRLEVRGAARG